MSCDCSHASVSTENKRKTLRVALVLNATMFVVGMAAGHCRLGVEAGLGEREARAALVLREGQDGVVAAERHAGTLGITTVPTYIFDGQYTLSGAQEPSNMAQILDQVAEFAAARETAP